VSGLASRRRADLALVAVWSRRVFTDRELLGRVHPVDGGTGWLAELPRGRTLGTYPTELEAVRAVLNSARRS
jgi:hypothetical protein